jgi:ketosteroid isomerase-like protein
VTAAANETVARRSIEAAARGDLESALADVHPEVEIDDTDIPDADNASGHDAYRKWIGTWDQAFESWRIEGLEMRGAGESVVALFEMIATGRGSGIELKRSDAIVTAFRDGKIAKIGYYNDQAKALAAAGLD